MCIEDIIDKKLLYLISEDFENIGNIDFNEIYASQDQKITQIYHLAQAVKSLHFIGKPTYLITPQNLVFTKNKNLKLFMPFFWEHFDNPAEYVFDTLGSDSFKLKFYYPPEIYEKDFDKKSFMTKFFPLLMKTSARKPLKSAFAVDIWGLGAIAYEILSKKKLIDMKGVLGLQGFYLEYLNPSKLSDKIKESIEKLTHIPKFLRVLITNMLLVDKKKRNTIFEVS